ncbi:MAG: hypothetical protein KME26_23780 [Oscillatoria princeps RMCB-10]|nr:hypothetical protein [Oscillatoria princeps RMCB-10]
MAQVVRQFIDANRSPWEAGKDLNKTNPPQPPTPNNTPTPAPKTHPNPQHPTTTPPPRHGS